MQIRQSFCFAPEGRAGENGGEMAEWFKAHAWKACILQKGIEGSNPSLSARLPVVHATERILIPSRLPAVKGV